MQREELLIDRKDDLNMSKVIKFKQKGEFKKTYAFFDKALNLFDSSILDIYGKKGVEALRSATPIDSGLTASSWYYEITNDGTGKVSLQFKNSNVNNGVNIAIILQYGHGTRNGGYVAGRDYINPAIQPIFDELADKAFREVSKL